MLTIAILIILSPIILMTGLFSLYIILAIIYSLISIPIGIARKSKEDSKKEQIDKN